MKKLVSCSIVLLVLCFAGPQPVAAQGWGGFMNWVNRLGPQFGGGGLSLFTSGFGPTTPDSDTGAFRLRLSGAYNWAFSSDDFIDPDGSSITMASINPMLEFRFYESGNFNFEIASGASFNRFGGDANGFWHTSFPAFLQVGWRVNGSDTWELKAGLGAHYWPEFETTDFAPLVVDVRRNESEITFPDLFVGFDIHW